MVARAFLLALLLAPIAGEELAKGLAADDECLAGHEEACGLNALQLRGAEVDGEADAASADVAASADFDASADLASFPDGYLAKICHNGRYCVVGGYLVIAGQHGAVGMESISHHNVGYYNSMMSAAHHSCGSSSCVLITNPAGHRSQSRFHIHYRHYNGAGSSLKHRLEKATCGKDGWHSGGFPCGGKAKYFHGFPGVFSAAMGSGSIAHAGITAWPSSCHGGTIILVTYHCSIEHSISSR